ncbi:aldehyde dehydrogenase [Mycolicibacterium elephantis]|nr:aldehyde dehydrogenase [Mycolicibacterium elephantis]
MVSEIYLGTRWLGTGSGGVHQHINPATGRPQADVPLAGRAEIDEAVAVAQTAFRKWRQWRPEDRRRLLTRIAARIREHEDELAVMQAMENGLPVSAAKAVLVPHGANWFENAAGWADKLEGTVVPTAPGETMDLTLMEPIGVVAVILTWNAPIGGWGMCVAPPLAAGCCVILKPSELAPFTSTFIARLCEEEGMPPGVITVLPGGPEAGAALVEHPGVRKISFTGGGPTGRRIAAACGAQLKPVLLELGGKSANIVFPDADLAKAVETAASVVFSAGQACTLPTRAIVHESIYDEFTAMLAGALAQVQVGDPLDPTTAMGPVISAAASDRILGMVNHATRDTGAELLAGGNRKGDELAAGYFIEPTLLGNVAPDSEVAQDEVFGPVTAAIRFSDEDEAVAVANGTPYGLAGYLHTRDLARALRVASALESGTVAVNGAGAPAGPGAPFGGVKESGYGREGGRLGVAEFLQHKTVSIALS